ncbi:MAG: phage tail length tape measure family protein [Rhizobiaceae bacterium]
MTLNTALLVKGDASGAKKVLKETRTELQATAKAAKAVGKASAIANNNMTMSAGKSVSAIKLNNQQLQNMQFQMNDMAVMMASGQNPFVMIMQQGMQIGQIFGPGSTVQGALKSTGAGIISFLTNPINLAIAGFAVAAGAASLLWDVMSGSEAKTAKEATEELLEFVDGLDKEYDDAAEAAKRYFNAAKPQEFVASLAKEEATKALKEYEVALASLQEKINGTVAIDYLSSFIPNVSEGIDKVKELGRAFLDGQISASELTAEVSKIADNEALPDVAIRYAREVRNGADEVLGLNANVKGTTVLVEQLVSGANTFAGAINRAAAGLAEQTIKLTSMKMDDPEKGTDLRKLWQREQKREQREAQRAARTGKRQAKQRQAFVDLLGDLEKEVTALNSVGAERTRLLAQLKAEQDIRSAINSAGANATADEISRLQILIPQRDHDLKMMREKSRMTKQLASNFASMTQQLLSGADASKVLLSGLANIGSQLLQKGFQMLLGGGGANPLSLLFSAKGNVFSGGNVQAFADGGVVNGPTFFGMNSGVGVMGEAGPESIMPLKRGADGKLGVISHGGNSVMEVRLAPGLIGSVLQQASGDATRIVQQAAPHISAAGAEQGKELAKEDFSRRRWNRV